MRVLVCGDRKWANREAIRRELIKLRQEWGLDLIVITGGCAGADEIADEIAEKLGIDRIIFPANWLGRKLAGGPYRNNLMLSIALPEKVLAFHRDINKSKGTKNMVNQARRDPHVKEVKIFGG